MTVRGFGSCTGCLWGSVLSSCGRSSPAGPWGRGDLELHLIALGQGAEALGRMAVKWTNTSSPRLLRDEPETLRVVEPLHFSLSHVPIPCVGPKPRDVPCRCCLRNWRTKKRRANWSRAAYLSVSVPEQPNKVNQIRHGVWHMTGRRRQTYSLRINRPVDQSGRRRTEGDPEPAIRADRLMAPAGAGYNHRVATEGDHA